ncbi:hypothetical protein TcWFU_004654 [Taenia crassiceps]|uniref:Peptidase S1 domain-containing protein n=1 Tax=Taenia crassiceps TaxID=6207 RepID=A0ABR4QR05_9CEST
MNVFKILFLASCPTAISGLLIEYPMTIEKAPFMATVGNCSGAIVSRNLVLVSGRCLCLHSRPTVVFAGTSWSNVHYLPKKEHRIRRFLFEREYGYCSQSRRSDFVLVELENSLIYSYRVQPIKLYCATHLPSQTAALGFHFPGQLYGFLNEALGLLSVVTAAAGDPTSSASIHTATAKPASSSPSTTPAAIGSEARFSNINKWAGDIL